MSRPYAKNMPEEEARSLALKLRKFLTSEGIWFKYEEDIGPELKFIRFTDISIKVTK